jgi:hypothetical protein
LHLERLIAVRESDDALFGLVIEGEWDALCGDWNYDLPLSLFVGGRLDLLIVRREDIDWIA